MDRKADHWKYPRSRISYLYEPYSTCYLINTFENDEIRRLDSEVQKIQVERK